MKDQGICPIKPNAPLNKKNSRFGTENVKRHPKQ